MFDSRVDHTAPTLVVRSSGYIRAGGELYAPAVKFAKAPKNKTKVTKTFAVTAKATDRYGITRVPLLVNGKVVATDSEAGYRFTVNPAADSPAGAALRRPATHPSAAAGENAG